ncbi:hypothetical protein HDV05_002205 [Chytridiales sp. JEL 0842]|nr:hypothetical protein HDV05_002205 [Chytridiales sp. JEL 0842]
MSNMPSLASPPPDLSADAAYTLATLHETGCPPPSSSTTTTNATSPYLSTPNLSPPTPSLLLLPPSPPLSANWYTLASSLGCLKSMVRLGALLTNPQLPDLYNPPLASTYLLAAAQKGNPDAQNLYGQLLELGLVGEPDVDGALECYKLAAQAGHGGSMYNLGALFESGVGVGRDFGRAVRMYEEAERRGNWEASERLEVLRSLSELPEGVGSSATLGRSRDSLRGEGKQLQGGGAAKRNMTGLRVDTQFATRMVSID